MVLPRPIGLLIDYYNDKPTDRLIICCSLRTVTGGTTAEKKTQNPMKIGLVIMDASLIEVAAGWTS